MSAKLEPQTLAVLISEMGIDKADNFWAEIAGGNVLLSALVGPIMISSYF